MNFAMSWLTALVTVAVLVTYEASLAVAQRRRPERIARTAHANLRKDWFEADSAQKGSEILAVQTLRNALMSASMTASTAALALMGTLTLAVPSLHGGPGQRRPKDRKSAARRSNRDQTKTPNSASRSLTYEALM